MENVLPNLPNPIHIDSGQQSSDAFMGKVGKVDRSFIESSSDSISETEHSHLSTPIDTQTLKNNGSIAREKGKGVLKAIGNGLRSFAAQFFLGKTAETIKKDLNYTPVFEAFSNLSASATKFEKLKALGKGLGRCAAICGGAVLNTLARVLTFAATTTAALALTLGAGIRQLMTLGKAFKSAEEATDWVLGKSIIVGEAFGVIPSYLACKCLDSIFPVIDPLQPEFSKLSDVYEKKGDQKHTTLKVNSATAGVGSLVGGSLMLLTKWTIEGIQSLKNKDKDKDKE